MQFSTLSIAAFAASMVSTLVSGTVFIGLRTAVDGSKSKIAWTNGTPDVCSGFTKIRDGDSNFCGINFSVDGGNGPFQAINCGGDGGVVLNRNGQFNSVCRGANVNINCPGGARIQELFVC